MYISLRESVQYVGVCIGSALNGNSLLNFFTVNYVDIHYIVRYRNKNV